MKIPSHLVLIVLLGLGGTGFAQQEKPAPPQVKVNFLNVCAPSESDKGEILAALNRLPETPRFNSDFEVARGRTTTPVDAVSVSPGAKPSGPPETSRWIRIRNEFVDSSPYLNAQYAFSVSEGKAEEALIFRLREPKDVMQVSISDEVEALVNPAQVVSARTPADRIRLERFGKSSVVLARCPGADQSAYEPLFQKASEVLNIYREQLGAKAVVAQDLLKTAERTPPANRSKTKRIP